MAAKRRATSNLYPDNWGREEMPEERGEFTGASAEEMQMRAIRKACRKAARPCGNVSGCSGIGGTSASRTAHSSSISFLSNTMDNESPTTSKAAFAVSGNVSSSIISSTVPTAISNSNFSFGLPSPPPPFDTKGLEIGKSVMEFSKPKEENSNYSNEYNTKIKQLNESYLAWIGKKIKENPVGSLTPAMQEYETLLKKINDEEAANNKRKLANLIEIGPNDRISKRLQTIAFGSLKLHKTAICPFGKSATVTKPFTNAAIGNPANSGSTVFWPLLKPSQFATPLKSNADNFGTKTNESLNKVTTAAECNYAAAAAFNFKPFNFKPFGFKSFSFKPNFNFGNIQTPPTAMVEPLKLNEDNNGANELAVPKVKFEKVIETDAFYSKKCKLFIKKNDDYGCWGLGTLYLKSLQYSEKTQLIVRADTILGNILVNIILNETIPSQRMGKNNVMIICVPNSQVKTPTATLFRVKTAEDADELFKMIKTHSK